MPQRKGENCTFHATLSFSLDDDWRTQEIMTIKRRRIYSASCDIWVCFNDSWKARSIFEIAHSKCTRVVSEVRRNMYSCMWSGSLSSFAPNLQFSPQRSQEFVARIFVFGLKNVFPQQPILGCNSFYTEIYLLYKANHLKDYAYQQLGAGDSLPTLYSCCTGWARSLLHLFKIGLIP